MTNPEHKLTLLPSHNLIKKDREAIDLTDVFPLQVLFQGFVLLQESSRTKWLNEPATNLVSATFKLQETIIHTQLAWGKTDLRKKNYNSCTCQPSHNNKNAMCHHMAALAIETNARLTAPLQHQEATRNSEQAAATFSAWHRAQTYDPYPNMARHRVVYIVEQINNRIVVQTHKAYLTKANNFQLKLPLGLSIVTKRSLSKFITLTDQYLLNELNDLSRPETDSTDSDNARALDLPRDEHLLKQLISTQHCFWKHCDKEPLTWYESNTPSVHLLELSSGLQLDQSTNRIICTDNQACPVQFTGTPGGLPLPIPKIRLETRSVHLPQSRNNVTGKDYLEMDVASVQFQIGNVLLTTNDLVRYPELMTAPGFRTQLNKIMGFITQLDQIPTVASRFELHVSKDFDTCDRYLDKTNNHWVGILRTLQLNDWQVIIDQGFSLNPLIADDWYCEVTTAQEDKATYCNTGNNGDLEIELGIYLEGRRINMLPYIAALIKNDQFYQLAGQDPIILLSNGVRLQLLHQRVEKLINQLIDLATPNALNHRKNLLLQVNRCAQLLNIQRDIGAQVDWQDKDWIKDKAYRLAKGPADQQSSIPTHLKPILRPYQRQGVEWLQHLRTEGLAGILADDMGLGKTLQTLTHIQIDKNNGVMAAPCVIVAPASLTDNWVIEAARFTPTLTALKWTGSKRAEKHAQLSSCDLIITSYGVLLRDLDILCGIDIHLLVLDEAQIIKNSNALVARSTYSLKARHRLCLTGTPLENHLGELWSLFHFLMPGFLGSEKQFNQMFRTPIEQHKNPLRMQALKQRIRPFVLRRMKDQVAPELPEKILCNEIIELNPDQRELYESIRLSSLSIIREALATAGHHKLTLNNAILKLRQVCCHPDLVTKKRSDITSAKMEWLKTLLPEMIESGHSILLFSSFTSMLDIISETLSQLSVPHLMLTGKTTDRQSLVDQFQAGDKPVFLISLKAGGTGLNLTQADTVIHFDPWWNPAAEAQATDRAHRIGQTKPVNIYKLITKGTIEEKIQALQVEKLTLANTLYQEIGNQPLTLTLADYEVLLSPPDFSNTERQSQQ